MNASKTFVQLATYGENDKNFKRASHLEPSLYQQCANLEWKATDIQKYDDNSNNKYRKETITNFLIENAYYQILNRSPDVIDNLILQTNSLDDISSIELVISEDKIIDSNDINKSKTTVIEKIDMQSLDILQTMHNSKIRYENTLILPFFMFKHRLPLLIVSLPYVTIYVKIQFKTQIPTDVNVLVQYSSVSGAARYQIGKSTPHNVVIDCFVPLTKTDIANSEEHSIMILDDLSLKYLFVSVYDSETNSFIYDIVDKLELYHIDILNNNASPFLLKDNQNNKARIIDPMLHGLNPGKHFMFAFNADNKLFSDGHHYVSYGHFNNNTTYITKNVDGTSCNHKLNIKIKLNNPDNKNYKVQICGIAIRGLVYAAGGLRLSF
jgi:hypothetical protein